jgi:hypothetical protein
MTVQQNRYPKAASSSLARDNEVLSFAAVSSFFFGRTAGSGSRMNISIFGSWYCCIVDICANVVTVGIFASDLQY